MVKKIGYYIIPLLVFFSLDVVVAHGVSPAERRLNSPSHIAGFASDVIPNELTDTHWSGDSLVVYERVVSGYAHAISVYGRDGKQKFGVPFSIDGAADIHISDAALAADGSVVVAAGSRGKDDTISNFIAHIGKDGKLLDIVRTTPYVVRMVCPIADGTVWTAGFERDEKLRSVKQYEILRQYSFKTGLVASALDASKMAHPADWPMYFPVGMYPWETALRATSKTLGFYSGPSNEWITLDLTTHEVRREPVKALGKGEQLTGFAMTESGQVFASIEVAGKNPSLGLFELVADQSGVRSWLPVRGTLRTADAAGDLTFTRLLGSTGNQIVYFPEAYPSTTVHWSTVAH